MRTTTIRIRVLGLLALALLVAGGVPRPCAARGGAAAPPKPPPHPAHVVLVILGGGVRVADMQDKDCMPHLVAWAEAGRFVKDVASDASDGYEAAGRILTGRAERLDGAAKPRPAWPTLGEYVRASEAVPASGCWLVAFEGGDRLHLAHSTHARYGAVVAPATTYGQGPFAQPMESFLERMGRPLPLQPAAWEQLRGLRRISRQAASIWLPDSVDAGRPRAEQVEQALLRELDRKALLNRGPNPRDEEVFRAARTVLAVHRPVLTVLLLGEAEQAQASYESYRAILAANDAGLERLRQDVEADSVLAGRTTFVVVADRPRAEKPDAAGRLGEAPASKAGRPVGVVIYGPGLQRRPRLKGPRALEDLCPSIGHLLGVETPQATGRAWLDLLEPR
ncbi:MAG: hypothetical protein O2894_05720 [Planctomycetota bacterium]|nr:hypothetical protein [Planctomycetota bacterium]